MPPVLPSGTGSSTFKNNKPTISSCRSQKNCDSHFHSTVYPLLRTCPPLPLSNRPIPCPARMWFLPPLSYRAIPSPRPLWFSPTRTSLGQPRMAGLTIPSSSFTSSKWQTSHLFDLPSRVMTRSSMQDSCGQESSHLAGHDHLSRCRNVVSQPSVRSRRPRLLGQCAVRALPSQPAR